MSPIDPLDCMTLDGFAPADKERGVGLLLRDDHQRIVFGVAGTQFACPKGSMFFCGVGGHRELGESWIECANREAKEEIRSAIQLVPSSETWLVRPGDPVRKVCVTDSPRPFALYEMPHLRSTYRIVIYEAILLITPTRISTKEIRALISITPHQLLLAASQPLSFSTLLHGGQVLVPHHELLPETLLYPIGTAAALATILQQLS